MKHFFCFFLFAIPILTFGQDNPDCYAEKDFLIIQSTKDYKAALQTAKQATKALDIKLDLRDLIPDNNTRIGLSEPVDTCLKYSKEYGGQDSTCYLARGRWDDGIYISIEYTNAYDSFTKGYYIVMVGSGFKKDQSLVDTLKKVKTKYSDAYIKTSKVYMCCMH
ncbi:MAG: hypothetical protein ACJ77K_18755 [Bacteroidia bacterium]